MPDRIPSIILKPTCAVVNVIRAYRIDESALQPPIPFDRASCSYSSANCAIMVSAPKWASARARPASPRRRARAGSRTMSRIARVMTDHVADGDQQPGLAVDDDLGGPRRGRGDDRLAESHRFEHHVGQSLVRAGQDEEIGRGQQPRDVVAMAQEPDLAIEMIAVCGLFQPLPQRAVACDQGTDVGLHVLEQVERLQEIVHALLLGQPAGEQDQRRLGANPNSARTAHGSTGGGSSSPTPE